MTLRFAFLMMLLVQRCNMALVNGEVPVVPQNTAVMIGESVYLTCPVPPNSTDVHWLYEYDTNYIYVAGKIQNSFKQRFSVSVSSGVSKLTISSVKPEDAGKYICEDRLFAKDHSAFLIVLDGLPSCKSNNRTDGFIGPNSCGIPPDMVELFCDVQFYGEIPPQMTLKSTGEDHPADGEMTVVPSANSDTSILRIKANVSLRDSTYSCQTTQSIGSQCEINNVIDIQGTEHALNKSVGEEVTCVANANKNCNYSWQLVQSNGNVSVHHSSGSNRIKLEIPGTYSCVQVCVIRDVPCAIPKMVVYVPEPETKEKKGLPLLALLLIFLLIPASFVVYLVRRTCRNGENTVPFDHSMAEKGMLSNVDDSHNQKGHIDQKDAVSEMNDPLLNKTPAPANICHETNGINTSRKGNTVEARTVSETSAANEPLITKANGDITGHGANHVEKLQNPACPIKTIKTKSAEDENNPIYGMTILGDYLFIVTGWSSEIEVWKLGELTFSRRFEVEMLIRPFDLVSCTRNNCLYIFDFKGPDVSSKEILRIDSNGAVITKWFLENDVCQSLSVTYDQNVIFATFEEDVPHIMEFNPDGKLLRSIKVAPDTQLNRILHVIKLEDNLFLISHGSIKFKNLLHRVCVVKSERTDTGEVVSCINGDFGNIGGSTETRVCVPMHLAINKDGTLLVADRENSRVLMLSWPELRFMRELIPKASSGLRKAYKLCLDDTRGHLFVIDNAEVPKTKWGNGRILVFEMK